MIVVPVSLTGVIQTSIRLCPKCEGQKHVAKPPWVPGDVHTWSTASTRTYPCPLCKGEGMVMVEPKDGYPAVCTPAGGSSGVYT